MRRLGVGMAAALLVSGGAVAIAQDKPRLNVLFAVADDASARHFGAYGCHWIKTPNFDRVAREGAVFANCFTPVPKCSPSRAGMLTGRYPWQLEEAADHYGVFPHKWAVYPEVLEKAGYAVGFTGKGWGPGDFKAGGFTRNPAGEPFNAVKLRAPTRAISNVDYAGNFRAFLKTRKAGEPFCFWYGGHEPHRPYTLGSGEKSGIKLGDVEVPGYLPDDEVVRGDLADYGREVEWFDEQLGAVLKVLEESGEAGNTIVVVTSDNGLPFPRAKGHVYEEACHMPLAVRWPGVVKGGTKVEEFVSLVDLAPTYYEATGVAGPSGVTGRSLVGLLKGGHEAGRDHVVLGRERTDVGRPGDVGYPVRSIRTAEYLYSRNFEPSRWPAGNPETGYADIDDGPSKTDVLELKGKGEGTYYDWSMARRGGEELYDLKSDPWCLTNLAGDAKYAEVKGRLWAELEKELREQADPRAVGGGEAFDRYEYKGPRKHAWDTVMGKK